MEYLVQVVAKSLTELSNEDLLAWYDENQSFANRRNELLLGPWRTIITRSEGVIAIAGSNENKYGKNRLELKIFIESFNHHKMIFLAAALTEFSPERKKKNSIETPRKIGGKKKQAAMKKLLRSRPSKYHLLIPPNTSDAVRLDLEQRQKTVTFYAHLKSNRSILMSHS